MALSVKAYLSGENGQQEIRRFAIDEGASANYGYLVQKIESVFPRIRGKKMKLFWKDSDDEMVTFSSDEELVEALGSFGGDVFRVYVTVDKDKGPAEEPQEEDNAQVHPNVTCDGCNKSLVGVRFKCAICHDFDLCGPCESEGLHNHHEMLRIVVPRTNPWAGFHFSTPPPPPPDASFAHPPHPFGPPHGPWGPWDFHGAHGRGHHGRGHHGRGHRGGPGPFRGRGGCGGPRGRCGRGAKCNRHGNRNRGEVPVGPPFLHHLGEHIASFLSPFGVEVHTYADNEQACCQGQCPASPESGQGVGAESTAQTEQASATASASATATAATADQPPDGDDCTCEKNEEGSPEDFEFVDDSAPPAETTEAAATEEQVDPLEVAIAQMRAMGFEDDSGTGWLSQLIKAKNYDIGKVLDAIHYDGKH